MSAAQTFRESRRLSRTWVLLLIVLSVPGVLVASGAVVADGPVDTGDWLVLALVVVPVVALPLAMAAVRLTVTVDADGLAVRLWPLHRSPRRVSADAITGVSRLDGSPATQFGGIGIRFAPGADGWFSGPVAYLVGGEESGVRIERDGSRTVVVGTERPTELVAALERVRER